MISKTTRTLSLDGYDIQLVTVENSDDILLAAVEHAETPLWLEIWPASVGLARWFLQGPDLTGRTVLELGCGLGLAGLAAAAKGAQVIMTDYVPESVAIAAESGRLNGFDTDGIVADWRDFKIKEKYDFIIGADICFHPELNPYLREIFSANHKPGGLVALSDPGRHDSAILLGQLAEDGWRMEKDTVPVSQGKFDYKIFVYKLKRG
jgi:predicted nicotinamide N-methyase